MEEFRKNGHKVIDWIADYYISLQRNDIDPRPWVQPGFLTMDEKKLANGIGFSASLQQFQDKVLPGK